MTTAGEISVELNGKDVNLSSLLIKVDQQAQKAADSAIRLQAQYARLANTQGNTAGATALLTNALKNNGGASEQALVGVANQLSGLQKGFQGGASYAQQFGAAAKSSLLGIVGPAALVTGSMAALKGAFDLTIAGAKADQVRQAFDALAKQAGTTGEALLGALRKASGGQINDLNLQLAANKANLLGVANNAEQLGVLMEIARDRAQKMGLDTTQAFDNLVTGLGRGSALILDNLGIIVKESEVYNAYAASVGKSAAALTDAEKKTALINAVLKQGQETIAATGGAADTAAGSFERLGTNIENAKNRLGSSFATAAKPVVDATNAVLGFTLEAEHTGASTANAAAGALRLGAAATGTSQALAIGTAQMLPYAEALVRLLGLLPPASAATQQHADAARQHAVATDEDRQALGAAQVAQATATQALADDIAKKQAAAIETQKLASLQQTLGSLGNLVASGLLTSGNAAAQLASQYGIAYAAALQLINAQAQIAGKSVAVARVTPNEARSEIESDKRGQLRADRQARIQQTQAAQRAEENYQRALGNNAPAIDRARRELAQLAKGTAAYYDKLTEITNLEKADDRKGRGGKAAKLSDQQKLNNSLLSDQEKFNEKFEDADNKHALKRLQIQQDYAEKARQAEIAFSDDQFESRASFYDRLSGIESGKIQQASSAAYEQAANEAGKIAAEKGADVADRYMAEQEKVILARAERLAAIETAQNGDKDGKNKDLARAEYLKGVDALYQQSEDRRLARIKEGNDSIATERAKALADEDRQYEQATGTIADKAETSADRRIAAAERAGKAIDTEAAKLTSLGQAYDRVSGVRPAPPDRPATPAASPTASAATPSAAPADIGQLIAKLDELRAALTGAAERGSRDIVGAVQGLRGSVFAG